MPDRPEYPDDVFIAYVGSKPLVVYIDGWVTGTIEIVTLDDEPVTYDGEPVTTVVF